MSVTITELEAQITNEKEVIRKANVLRKLFSNPDFKEIILDGYCTKEAIRLTKNLRQPEFETAVKQENLFNKLGAISELQEYFRVIEIQAQMSEKNIISTEDEISNVMAEEE